jgi:hypothetical protein
MPADEQEREDTFLFAETLLDVVTARVVDLTEAGYEVEGQATAFTALAVLERDHGWTRKRFEATLARLELSLVATAHPLPETSGNRPDQAETEPGGDQPERA